MLLVQQDYGEITANHHQALNTFYSLAFFKAILLLAERAYWGWKISYCRLVEEVNRECGFGSAGLISIRRFFYDTYSRCINGSIFDGLKMKIVSFVEELLVCGSKEERLIGAKMLWKLSDKMTRRIRTSTIVIEKLVEMLNSKDLDEDEIRRVAAAVVLKLVGKTQMRLKWRKLREEWRLFLRYYMSDIREMISRKMRLASS